MTVDGVDVRIPERGRDWYSHKFKKSAVRYEIAVSILGGDIVWLSGPHQPGLYNDLDIFRLSLATFLEPFERVEADDGYAGEAPLKVKCPSCITVPEKKKKMMSRVRSRQETVNKRLKDWSILRQTYRHNIIDHRDVMGAICVITQLAINNGECLFEVEFED